jgi:HEPN domain-containing protein
MRNSVSNPDAWLFFANNNIMAAEKAFLAKHKVSFQKTHDLLKLYSQVKEVKDLDINEELLNDLVGLYIESRYPTDVALLEGGLLPSTEKAKAYLDFAKSIADIVKSECANPMPE